MELKRLVKNTSYLASTSVVQFFVGLIRAKINAVFLGTIGMGVISQISFFTSKITELTTLGMSSAVVKQIAESSDKQQNLYSSIKSYVFLVFGFMILFITILFVFSHELSNYLFGNDEFYKYYFYAIASLPILIINSVPFAILKGYKNIKAISRARIATIIVNLIIFVPLVFFFQLDGAALFMPLSLLIALIFNYYYAKKYYLVSISIRTIIDAPIKRAMLKEQLLFSGLNLIKGPYFIFSEFFCRTIVIQYLGIEALGLYSPVITWAGLFIGFLLPSFSTYLFPRFAEARSNKEISGILNDAFRLSTFALIPLLFLGISYRYFFIELFYSNDFISAGKYLPLHFIGVIFYVWWFIFTQSMTPTGRIKQHAVFHTLFMTLDIVVTYLAVPIWGLYGWMLKYMISPFVFFIVYYIYAKFSLNFKFDKSNFFVMLYILSASIFLIIMQQWQIFNLLVYFLGPMLLLVTWFIIKKNEKAFVLLKLKVFSNRVLKL